MALAKGKNQDPRIEGIARMKDTGDIWIVFKTGDGIPAAIAALSAGKDKWLQDVRVPCLDKCGKWGTARHLYQETSVPGCCDACSDAFWCPVCGGHPDDCGGEGICEGGEEV